MQLIWILELSTMCTRHYMPVSYHTDDAAHRHPYLERLISAVKHKTSLYGFNLAPAQTNGWHHFLLRPHLYTVYGLTVHTQNPAAPNKMFSLILHTYFILEENCPYYITNKALHCVVFPLFVAWMLSEFSVTFIALSWSFLDLGKFIFQQHYTRYCYVPNMLVSFHPTSLGEN